MLFFSTIILLIFLSCASTGITAYHDQQPITTSKDVFDSIRKALKKADIIDEVIDDFQPKCFVAPFYTKKQRPVVFGNKFKQSKTKGRPSLKVYCPNMKSTPGLTIALTDPDAPSKKNPKWAEMCHWIATVSEAASDVETSLLDLKIDLDSTSTSDLVEYKPPGPPAKTGYHRYIFLLLEGDATNLTAPEDRQHWGTGRKRHGVRDWAETEGLKVVGANFFVEKNKKQ